MNIFIKCCSTAEKYNKRISSGWRKRVDVTIQKLPSGRNVN